MSNSEGQAQAPEGLHRGLFHVAAAPDGVRTIALHGELARRMAAMTMHQTDLGYSRECLEALTADPRPQDVVVRALWHTAVQRFVRCFDSQSPDRSQLASQKVFDQADRKKFAYFNQLRHQHLAHDVLDLSQCHIGAVLLAEDRDHKIGEIVSVRTEVPSASPQRVADLRTLITAANSYCSQQFQAAAKIAGADLESRSYAELLAMPELSYTAPDPETLAARRGIPRS